MGLSQYIYNVQRHNHTLEKTNEKRDIRFLSKNKTTDIAQNFFSIWIRTQKNILFEFSYRHI